MTNTVKALEKNQKNNETNIGIKRRIRPSTGKVNTISTGIEAQFRHPPIIPNTRNIPNSQRSLLDLVPTNTKRRESTEMIGTGIIRGV